MFTDVNFLLVKVLSCFLRRDPGTSTIKMGDTNGFERTHIRRGTQLQVLSMCVYRSVTLSERQTMSWRDATQGCPSVKPTETREASRGGKHTTSTQHTVNCTPITLDPRSFPSSPLFCSLKSAQKHPPTKSTLPYHTLLYSTLSTY